MNTRSLPNEGTTPTAASHPRFQLNEAMHQPVRLSLLAALAHSDRVDFAFLRDHLGLKDANLSQHLTALGGLGYIAIAKVFEGKRARTWVSLTPEGQAAFAEYLTTLHRIVENPLDGE